MWRQKNWNTTNFLSGKFHVTLEVALQTWLQPNLLSYLLSDAVLMINLRRFPRLLQLLWSPHGCSSDTKLLLWRLCCFLSLMAAPSGFCVCRSPSPWWLYHETAARARGRLSIKMTGMPRVYSEQAFKELRLSSVSCFFSASHEHLHLRQNTLSQPLFIWICLLTGITESYSGLCLMLQHKSFALFIIKWYRLTMNKVT